MGGGERRWEGERGGGRGRGEVGGGERRWEGKRRGWRGGGAPVQRYSMCLLWCMHCGVNLHDCSL